MPTVPVFADAQNVVREQAMPNARSDVQASPEAFNNGQSTQNLDNAEMGLAKSFNDVAAEQRARADQIAHIQADTKASQLQNQIQINASRMKGQDALGATEYATKAWNDGVNEIRSGLNGKNQQLAFDRSSGGRFQELNKSVEMHAFQQCELLQDHVESDGIKQNTDSAVLNAGDNELVAISAARVRERVDQKAKRGGVPMDSDQYKQMLMQALSPLHKDVISAKIEAGVDDDDVKKYFADHRGEMTAGDLLHTKAQLDQSEVISKGEEIFGRLKSMPGLRFSDGTINREKARSIVMDMEGMSDQRKVQLLRYVDSEIHDDSVAQAHKNSDHDLYMKNQLIGMAKSGAPLADRMKFIAKGSKNAVDLESWSAVDKELNGPASHSDIQVKNDLHDQLTDGTLTKATLDEKLRLKALSGADWITFNEQLNKTKKDGTDPQMKSARELVKAQIAQDFGAGPEAKQIQAILDSKTVGKSADEYQHKYNELKKEAPGTGIFGSDWFRDKAFKGEMEKANASGEAWGATESTIGHKQTLSIVSTIASQPGFEKKKVTKADVDGYVEMLGGQDQLKLGTPTNNAIIAISAHGRGILPTPANIKHLLDIYPDGNAPPGAFRK